MADQGRDGQTVEFYVGGVNAAHPGFFVNSPAECERILWKFAGLAAQVKYYLPEFAKRIDESLAGHSLESLAKGDMLNENLAKVLANIVKEIKIIPDFNCGSVHQTYPKQLLAYYLMDYCIAKSKELKEISEIGSLAGH